MVFSKLTRKKVRFFTPETFINFLSTVIIIAANLRWHFHFKNQTPRDHKYYTMISMAAANNDYIRLPIVAALIVACQWGRVFFILKAEKVIGPYIEILTKMLWEVFKFALVYIVVFVVFLSIGNLLFYNIDEFANDWKGVIYLFNASLGEFDFNIFKENQLRAPKEQGWVYLIIFLILTNIVMVNFLIAILSNKYTVMEEKSKILYRQNILLIKQVQTVDPYYSSLISSFVPLNVILLPLMPFIIFLKSKKLNTILLFVCYSPLVLLSTLVFLVSSIILIPFASIILGITAIKAIVMYFMYEKKTRQKTVQIISWNIMLIFFSPIYLL